MTTTPEWVQEVRDYWRAECAATDNDETRHWYADMVEVGLAPAWAMGDGPPDLTMLPPQSFPLLDEWFRFDHAPDSPEEMALLQQIGRKGDDLSLLARGLRANATTEDLLELARTYGMWGGVARAIQRHPAVDRAVLQELSSPAGYYAQHFLLEQPRLPTRLLVRLLCSDNADVRRQARRHPDTPADAREITRRALLRPLREQGSGGPPYFGFFIACLHTAPEQNDYLLQYTNRDWTARLGVALLTDEESMPTPDAPAGHLGTPILRLLAADENPLVRAAAQTRLDDPGFVFTWEDE